MLEQLNHHDIFISITEALKNVQKDLPLQKQLFNKTRASKKYTGVRQDKGYSKWKNDVLKRFDKKCCLCNSDQKLVSHHLYSYKYYPDLRTELNNGVCLCNTCHEEFNHLYTNVNTLEQFLEYRELINNQEIRNYLAKAFRIYNINQTIALYKSIERPCKIFKFNFLRIIVTDKIIYCGTSWAAATTINTIYWQPSDETII